MCQFNMRVYYKLIVVTNGVKLQYQRYISNREIRGNLNEGNVEKIYQLWLDAMQM